MKNRLLTFLFICLGFPAFADTYLETFTGEIVEGAIGNANISTEIQPPCGTTVYDSGGAMADYGNNENVITTICPDNLGEIVSATFTLFNSENNGVGCYDGLTIHDGDSNASPTINTIGGSSLWCWDTDDFTPSGTGNLQGMTITSSDPTGCLTFVFTSDGSSTRDGYEVAITCAAPSECAATCADVATISCSYWTTPSDVLTMDYEEIEANGGASCFLTPIDVSTADQAVTQCFEYEHNAFGSTSFIVLSAGLVVENGDVNGTNDCVQSITNVEIFDASCTSLLTGVQGLEYTSAVEGTSYTICVTASAGNGIAEGTCEFQCLANSVTPIGELPEPLTCADFVLLPSLLVENYCSGNNEVDVVIVEVCPDNPTESVRIEIDAGTYDAGDAITFYSGIPGASLNGTVIQTNTGILDGVIATSLVGECITMVSNTDGFGSCLDESLPPIFYEILCVLPSAATLNFTCGVDVDPFVFCYENDLSNFTVAEICPQSATETLSLTVNAGEIENDDYYYYYCYDELFVFSGGTGTGSLGTMVPPTGIVLDAGACGDYTGATYTAANPGDCLSFVITSDYIVNSCETGGVTPFSVSCASQLPSSCDALTTPQTYCYASLEEDVIIQEICPTSPDEGVEVQLTAGEYGITDSLTFYFGAEGSGTTGTFIQSVVGEVAGITVTSPAGECLTLVSNSATAGPNCDTEDFLPLSYTVSCYEPILFCADFNDVDIYCTDNNEVNVIIQEVCPDTPTDLVQIRIFEGEGGVGDNITFYSGIAGAGATGTLISTNSGDMTGVIAQSLLGECLTMISNTDATGSCVDELFTEIEYEITCVLPPAPTLEFTCGVDAEPYTFCYGNDLSNFTVAEICPQSATETLSLIVNAGVIEGDDYYYYYCYDELNVFSGGTGTGSLGTLVPPMGIILDAGNCGDYTGATYTAANPGDCLSFVITSDYTVNSCDLVEPETPFSVSCAAPACTPNPGTIAPE